MSEYQPQLDFVGREEVLDVFETPEEAAKRLERENQDLKAENLQLKEDLINSELARLCDSDITFLLNKPGMQLVFAEIQENMADDDTVLLAFLDLDNFTEINEIAGHIGADQILAGYAAALVNQVRAQGDAVARHGGDEFVVMVNLNGENNYYDFLSRLSQPVKVPYLTESGYRQYEVTSSIGVTVVTKDTVYYEALTEADFSAQHVKQNGRNGVALKLPGSEVSMVQLEPSQPIQRKLDTRG